MPPPTDEENPDTLSAGDFTVDGKWQAVIDGLPVTGTIDTSFVEFAYSSEGTDTIISCFGTSHDKKFNIEFLIFRNINSQSSMSGNSKQGFFATLAVDSLSKFGWRADNNSDAALIQFNIDSLSASKIQMRFTGTVDGGLQPGVHTITDGKMSCEFNTGNGEPGSMIFQIGELELVGISKEASIISNTLVIEGIHTAHKVSFAGYGQYRMLVHTGGTLAPGSYKSSEGKTSFAFSPSVIKDYYADDSIGEFDVVIDEVAGNIVSGHFLGKTKDGEQTSGKFSCRVKNYIPEADTENKWTFSETDYFWNKHNIYGGNMTGIVQRHENGLYYMTLTGETDNGRSTFSIAIHSSQPISPGIYYTDSYAPSPLALDSMVFNSAYKKIYDQTDIKLFMYAHPSYMSNEAIAHCVIESVADGRVTGSLHGLLFKYQESLGVTPVPIKGAGFSVSY